jgi:signal peptide peptidase SppA
MRDLLWYGNEASAQAAAEAEALIASKLDAGGPFDGIPADYLLSKNGSVGIIAIKGPLLNTDSPIAAFFGMSTYPAIRASIISAVQDPEIKQILLDIDSGGGAVSGVVDTAELISRVNKVKPVTSFADGGMLSAAYWLGSSAGKVFAGKTALTGSIGVITRHVDLTKQLEQDGVKVEVLRAGKYKALASPFEPLSDAARDQIQSQLDAAYQIFVQHVADSRDVSFAEADKKMAQGREFFGAQAVESGLIDGISSFDEVMSKLSSKGVDKRAPKYDNGMKQGANKDMTPRKTLTEQDLAALAEGGAAAKTEAEVKAEADAAVAAEAAAKTAADAATAAAATAAAEAAAAAAAKPAAGESAVVQLLRSQLAEKDEKIVAQTLELSKLNEKLAGIEATHEAAVAVVRASVGRMRVALGSSAGDAETLKSADALAEHKRLSEEFGKKFKVGGVAAVTPKEESEQGSKAAAPLHASLVAAARFNK